MTSPCSIVASRRILPPHRAQASTSEVNALRMRSAPLQSARRGRPPASAAEVAAFVDAAARHRHSDWSLAPAERFA